MATVPGKPSDNVVPMLPPWAQPTAADFLQAAAITHEKQQALEAESKTFDERFGDEKQFGKPQKGLRPKLETKARELVSKKLFGGIGLD